MSRPESNSVFSASSSVIARFPSGANSKARVPSSNLGWYQDVVNRFEALLRLEVGWDGYHGQPVSLDNVMFAIAMLERTCNSAVSPPQIVPGTSGDLQIEWHTRLGDLELYIERPYNIKAYFYNVKNNQEIEMDLSTDVTKIIGWVNTITEPDGATNSAAA